MMITGFRHRAASIAMTLGLTAIGLAAAAAAPAPTSSSIDQRISVSLDRAKLLRLPEHVDTIVVGNPIIADVTMLKRSGQVVITGKGFGETNVIFLDSSGEPISEALVSVQDAQGLLTVQRGLDRESYSCLPRCEPAIALGDASKFMSDTSSQISSRNGLAAPGGH